MLVHTLTKHVDCAYVALSPITDPKPSRSMIRTGARRPCRFAAVVEGSRYCKKIVLKHRWNFKEGRLPQTTLNSRTVKTRSKWERKFHTDSRVLECSDSSRTIFGNTMDGKAIYRNMAQHYFEAFTDVVAARNQPRQYLPLPPRYCPWMLRYRKYDTR